MKNKQKLLVLSMLVVNILIIQTFALVSAIYIPPGEDPPTKYRVTGIVRDSVTNEYVSGATVKVYKGTTYLGSTTTTSTGYFNKYIYSYTLIFFFTVQIIKSGYNTKSVTEEVVRTTCDFGTILLTPTAPPQPPAAPVISNVQTTVNGLDDVSIAWDMTWGSGATSWETKLWWGEDSAFTGVTPITFTDGSTHYVVDDLPVDYTPNVYWYKIEASNGNSGGTTYSTPVGPTSILLKHYPTDDSFTYAEMPSKNYDSDPYWYDKLMVATGDSESPGLFRSWLKFSIDNPQLVQSATLRAYIYGIEPYGHGTITAYQTGTNWVESSITYTSSQSIWVGSALASDTSGSAGSWDSWDITALAQQETVISIMLEPSGGQLRGAHYYSREYSNVALRPYLEIEYLDSLVFYDECSDLGSWSLDSTYDFFPYSPLSYSDLSDDYTLLSSTGQYYLHESGGGAGTTRGTAYHRSLSQEIPLYNLESFEVSFNYNYQSDFRQGSLIVALYDNDYISNYRGRMTKSMVVAELFVETEYGSTPKMSINAYYVDENLNEQTQCLSSQISQSWSGAVTFWYDVDGLWVKISSGSPILLANWKEANMRREIGHVVLQGIGMGSPIPTLSVDNIEVITKSPISPFKNLRMANELRSGPKDIGLSEPGPTNELQFFPLNGEGLEFEMYRTAAFYDILLDVRAIPFASPPPSNPTIEIKINDETVDTYQVTVDPVQDLPTANYLHESTWTSLTAGYVTIELTIDGWSNLDGIVALRGIWVMKDLGADGRFLQELGQVFPDSGELIYYLPMGPTTNLDLEWEGDDGIEVSVDGHAITWTSQGIINIDLGSYSRGTIHELKLKHTGILHMQSRVNVMHTSHFWMNVEVDFFEWDGIRYVRDDLRSILDYIETFFEENTHGRIEAHYSPTQDGLAIDPAPYNSEFTDIDIIGFGNDGGFLHRGERDWYWMLYTPFGAGFGGSYYKSNSINGRERWVGTRGTYEYPYEGVLNAKGLIAMTMHEFGHLAHVHEGPNPPTFQGEICTYETCPMGPTGPDDVGYCQFHWFQTWYNTRPQSPGEYEYNPDWLWDWWLI